MPYLIGLIIALFITLTGVGAGTITVPVLVLFLGVPAPIAVGIGLMFASVVKLILVPAQIVRGNVAWRTLGYMLLGGIPGVLIGSLFLKHLVTAGSLNVINAVLGIILVTTASLADSLFFPARSPALGGEGPQPLALVAHVPRRRGGGLLLRRRRRAGLGGASQPHASRARRRLSEPTSPSASSSPSSAAARTGSRRCQRRHSPCATHRRRRDRRHWRNARQHPHPAPPAAVRFVGLASGARRPVPLQQLQGLEPPRQGRRAPLHRRPREVDQALAPSTNLPCPMFATLSSRERGNHERSPIRTCGLRCSLEL